MKMSAAFPSQYLKAADLNGRTVRVIMRAVEMEPVGRDKDLKPVLYFEGKEKGMVLNKTNANKIVDTYGDDTDQWPGGEIELYEAQVDFQGETVEAIRVRMPKRAPSVTRLAPSEINPPDLDDEVPF